MFLLEFFSWLISSEFVIHPEWPLPERICGKLLKSEKPIGK